MPTLNVYEQRPDGLHQVGTVDQPVEVVNADAMRQRIVAAMAQAENALANWATLTPAQKDAANKAALAGVVRLARIVLGVLDAAP